MNHNKWMKYAILEALRSKGSTGMNPPVGCVIVKNENIILFLEILFFSKLKSKYCPPAIPKWPAHSDNL